MARIQSPEQLTALVGNLFDKRVEATIKLLRTSEGMEADVLIEPTEDLAGIAGELVQSDLGLGFDGTNVRVLAATEGLPEERTVET